MLASEARRFGAVLFAKFVQVRSSSPLRCTAYRSDKYDPCISPSGLLCVSDSKGGKGGSSLGEYFPRIDISF